MAAFLAFSGGMRLAPGGDMDQPAAWDSERQTLLGRRISELGLSIRGSRVERLVHQLYEELAAKNLAFKPPVYLSDEWGCPDATPLIGVPFYLADPRLERIEAEVAGGVEGDPEAMRYLRHEAGHAYNYAYRLYDRPDWRRTFGPYSRPYRDRYHVDPFSRAYVRHILGWYAQKHPDEDFAESFAVWLTPGLDWRREYAGWPALKKVEYVDRVMRKLAEVVPDAPTPTDDDLPVEAMHYTIADHYRENAESLPLVDRSHFDGDLRTLFATTVEAPTAEPAQSFLRRHERELVSRIAYWTGESPTVVRSLVELMGERAEAMELRMSGLEASTLIELTAFGTAVIMNYRYTDAFDGGRASAPKESADVYRAEGQSA
jgi:hypothetical protein